MRVFVTWLLVMGLAAGPAVAGGDPNKDSGDSGKNPPTSKPENSAKNAEKQPPASLDAELRQMRELLQAQAQQLEAQRAALEQQRSEIEALKGQMGTIRGLSTQPLAPGNPGEVTGGAFANNSSIRSAPESSPLAGGSSAGPQDKSEGPVTLRYKGITLTPGGFFAAETVYRNRATSADVNTPFTAIPFSGSDLSKTSEFNASGRQSRISMLAEGKIASAKIGGYYEADFLSAGTTSNNNQSNGYTFRQRQFWAQAALESGWTFTGGQMWSLVAETRKGLNNRTEATPLTIDAQYTAGFSWARQYAFRIVKDLFEHKLFLGFAVEDSQTTLTVHGQSNNFFFQAAGQGGGTFNATNNYTLNATPDFVFKAAFEPGWGHYEIFGLLRTFRARVYPCALASVAVPCPVDATVTAPSALHAFNDQRTGGGAGINIRVPLFNKKLDVGFHGLYGDGVGRYGTIGLKDATVRPNGTLAPLRGGQGLGTIEWHATPKLDIYLNGGVEYVARGFFITTPQTAAVAGVATGYGSPFLNNSGCNAAPEALPTSGGLPSSAGSCTGDPRNVVEGTFGFWHRFYKGDKGTLQWGLQYSYVALNAWSGTNGSAVTGSPQFKPHANENMVFTSFRYYIP